MSLSSVGSMSLAASGRHTSSGIIYIYRPYAIIPYFSLYMWVLCCSVAFHVPLRSTISLTFSSYTTFLPRILPFTVFPDIAPRTHSSSPSHKARPVIWEHGNEYEYDYSTLSGVSSSCSPTLSIYSVSLLHRCSHCLAVKLTFCFDLCSFRDFINNC